MELSEALRTDRLIDIVTVGARTGTRRVTEIWFTNIGGRIIICGTPSAEGGLGPRKRRDWLANLKANPRFEFCLKESVVRVLPAKAVEVTDLGDRRGIMSAPETQWYRDQGFTLRELVDHSPIVEVTFLNEYSYLNASHVRYDAQPMGADPWLDRWLDLIKARAGSAPVLELGCGPGIDTATLTGAGLRVVAFDKAEAAVIAARKRALTAVIEVRNLLEEFPSAATGFNVVLASLSLHYFHWKETIALFAKVRAALNEGGLFVCRLNSTEDHAFGARGYPEIEPNFYLVNGRSKRFFARRDVETLMRDRWRVLSLEHLVVDRYDKPKALWELVAEASDACS